MLNLKWKNIFLLCWYFMGYTPCFTAEQTKEESNLSRYCTDTREYQQPQLYQSYIQPPSLAPYHETYNPYPSAPYMDFSLPREEKETKALETVDCNPGNPRWEVFFSELEPMSPQSTAMFPSSSQQELVMPMETSKPLTLDDRAERIRLLEEQNEILRKLLALGYSNQEQLNAVSEALGVKFETSERNQEQLLHSVEDFRRKFTIVTDKIKSDQKSTLYMAYHTVQGGLLLSRSVFAGAAVIKTLSFLPAFIIPGWAVYATGIGIGASMYFLKL